MAMQNCTRWTEKKLFIGGNAVANICTDLLWQGMDRKQGSKQPGWSRKLLWKEWELHRNRWYWLMSLHMISFYFYSRSVHLSVWSFDRFKTLFFFSVCGRFLHHLFIFPSAYFIIARNPARVTWVALYPALFLQYFNKWGINAFTHMEYLVKG